MDTVGAGTPGYLIGTLRDVSYNEELQRYVSEIQATLIPYGGHFIVRGSAPEMLEGTWSAEGVVIIEFPSVLNARQWYASPAYQEIRELRTRNATCDLSIVEGLTTG